MKNPIIINKINNNTISVSQIDNVTFSSSIGNDLTETVNGYMFEMAEA
ncbi:MAG: hypothetical protein LBV41_08175 [Cytophagaceae bacterium]|nr:hypothetical protein [Cytophagaceae bacterium]